jgi:hypothetical protein
MENNLEKFDLLQRKQELIKKYYFKILELEGERKGVNAKIKRLKERFQDLISNEAKPEQLNLFENIEAFIQEI